MQVVENDKISTLHQRVYNKYQNTLGKRISTEFYTFLATFVLSPDDPNYEAYADMEDEPNAQIRYYVRLAEQLKVDEMKTLYVDFTHLSCFQWEDAQFMDRLQSEYVRFEPYLRQGLTMFLADAGH